MYQLTKEKIKNNTYLKPAPLGKREVQGCVKREACPKFVTQAVKVEGSELTSVKLELLRAIVVTLLP
jgi:hypothetical protein